MSDLDPNGFVSRREYERDQAIVTERFDKIEIGLAAMSEKNAEQHGENRVRAEHAEKAMERGFKTLSDQIVPIKDKLTLRATIIAGASGFGGGAAVGVYALLHSLGKL
ncbi:hypothetical protein [Asaia prunellae]|uniref:hypothetical protein n=1 Tax=Asaia prunellae TaxID=610245 RepID=UPI000471C6D9|nr:hypothetical protein [Asaia prunellae]